MGNFGSKARSDLLKNLVFTLEALSLVRLSCKLVRMFVFMKSLTSLKMGHVGSKTRSLDQTLEKTLCMLQRPDFRSDTNETSSEFLPG